MISPWPPLRYFGLLMMALCAIESAVLSWHHDTGWVIFGLTAVAVWAALTAAWIRLIDRDQGL